MKNYHMNPLDNGRTVQYVAFVLKAGKIYVGCVKQSGHYTRRNLACSGEKRTIYIKNIRQYLQDKS